MKKILFTFMAICLVLISKAQITTVCGTDTIILQVDNYKRGFIQWEESLDNEAWVTIDNAIGETYKFFPSETKYYRASVITSECDPLISEVTLVQLAPVSYAGSDREVGGETGKLLGSYEVGTTGIWSILEGEEGSFSNPSDPYSEFSGKYDVDYQLLWTTTNGCGQSIDTMSIIFEEIKTKDNFIVVDNTDHIISDSADHAAGIYKIVFSDSTIIPSDTMMLIGMREDISFIVKIESFTKTNNIYTINTVVGGLEDVITAGPINVGDGVNSSIVRDGKKSGSLFPTRETLKSYANNKQQKLIYSSDLADQYGNKMYVTRKKSNSNGLVLSIPDQELFSSNDGIITASIADAYVRFKPNFVCDFKVVYPVIKDIKIGIDNGEFEYNYTLTVEATAAKELSKDVDVLQFSNIIVFMAGPVPIVISTTFAINASASLSASATLSLEEKKNYQKNFTALLQGDRARNVQFTAFSSTKTTTESNYSMQGRLDAEFSVGPVISLELYKVIGPYFELPLTLSAEICVNKDLNWDAQASLSIAGNMGVRAHVGSFTLFDLQHNLFTAELMKPLKMPYKVSLLAGNSQVGFEDMPINNPIKLKVISSYGFGVPFVPVRFWLDEGNGIMSDDVIFTDKDGKVTVDDWVLGNNDQSQLEVSVLNCDDEDIDINSPLTIYAYTKFDCSNGNMAININKSDTSIIPIVTGGTVPYTYSTDGSSYNTTVPEFNYNTEGTFKVYVKDANSCKLNKAITVAIQDPCTINPLFIDVYTDANTLRMEGVGGNLPYQFAIDDVSSFSENNVYSNLTEGSHTVYIKDAKDCTTSNSITFEPYDANAINAIKPKNKAMYYSTSNVNFLWQSGLYANNQIYDIYLKKDSAEYATVAEDIAIEDFTYDTDLVFSSLYHWKLMIKDENGIKQDSNEFSFSTMADPSIVIQTPTLIFPLDSTLVNDSVTFKWQKQDGDYKYDLYIDNNLTAYGLSTDTFCINNLTPTMNYSWQVKIRNIITGETRESAIWNYEVKSLRPNLESNVILNVSDTFAVCGGTILSEGLSPVTSRGICWSKVGVPTIDSNMVIMGSGPGFFEDTIGILEPDTTYLVRAFAINANGVSYGSMDSIKTLPPRPTAINFVFYMNYWDMKVSDAGGNCEISGWVMGTVTDSTGSIVAEQYFWNKGETDIDESDNYSGFDSNLRTFRYTHKIKDADGMLSAKNYTLTITTGLKEHEPRSKTRSFTDAPCKIDLGSETLLTESEKLSFEISGNAGKIELFFTISTEQDETE